MVCGKIKMCTITSGHEIQYILPTRYIVVGRGLQIKGSDHPGFKSYPE